ncbi:MSP domain-containing protein [Caenorhabditis elegans]|uniref:MSP domain-containing protein n=1 Tax=Caenorhabditis elegans TaxID=6239 RepID=Q23428_CAEEL|nr:MSP domain-containing protein [Caenorhabditis elegans]CCD72514.1 MSP domain-containing protein [Caenorhabditis elegans]|eukprot:NP_495165.1 Uncharacterized protein CELE_ZK1248.17 [Caenorhabditis elegans]
MGFGDIQTQPGTYSMHHMTTSTRITSRFLKNKTTNMKRLGVDPPCGVPEPKEDVLLAVSCDAFAFGQDDTNNDRITVEWTNTPDGAAKQFRREWF